MSKSYDNTIEIFCDEPTLKRKVMGIVTDSTPVDQPKNPETCNLFQIFRHFAPAERVEEVHNLYVNGGGRVWPDQEGNCSAFSGDFFRENREERTRLLNDPGHIREVLAAGAAKARDIASSTIEDVRRKVGLVCTKGLSENRCCLTQGATAGLSSSAPRNRPAFCGRQQRLFPGRSLSALFPEFGSHISDHYG